MKLLLRLHQKILPNTKKHRKNTVNYKFAIKEKHLVVLSVYLILYVLEQLFMKGQIILLPAGYIHKNKIFK